MASYRDARPARGINAPTRTARRGVPGGQRRAGTSGDSGERSRDGRRRRSCRLTASGARRYERSHAMSRPAARPSSSGRWERLDPGRARSTCPRWSAGERSQCVVSIPVSVLLEKLPAHGLCARRNVTCGAAHLSRRKRAFVHRSHVLQHSCVLSESGAGSVHLANDHGSWQRKTV